MITKKISNFINTSNAECKAKDGCAFRIAAIKLQLQFIDLMILLHLSA